MRVFIKKEVNPHSAHSIPLEIRQKVQKSPDLSWHSQKSFLIEEGQGKQVEDIKIHLISKEREKKRQHQMILP